MPGGAPGRHRGGYEDRDAGTGRVPRGERARADTDPDLDARSIPVVRTIVGHIRAHAAWCLAGVVLALVIIGASLIVGSQARWTIPAAISAYGGIAFILFAALFTAPILISRSWEIHDLRRPRTRIGPAEIALLRSDCRDIAIALTGLLFLAAFVLPHHVCILLQGGPLNVFLLI